MAAGIINVDDDLFLSLSVIWTAERERVRNPDMWQVIAEEATMMSIDAEVPRVATKTSMAPWEGGARKEQGADSNILRWTAKLFEATVAMDRDELQDINRFGQLVNWIRSLGNAAGKFRNEMVFPFLEAAVTSDTFTYERLGMEHEFSALAYDDVRLFGTHPNNGFPFTNADLGNGPNPLWYMTDSTSFVKPVLLGNRREIEFYEFQDEFKNSNRFKWGQDGRFSIAAGEPAAIWVSDDVLTDDSFDTVRTAMGNVLLENGTPARVAPDTLIVGAANERRGREVLRDRQANGADNVFAGVAQLVVVHDLTATGA
jgi:phage major head subunit gpT-like protein